MPICFRDQTADYGYQKTRPMKDHISGVFFHTQEIQFRQFTVFHGVRYGIQSEPFGAIVQ